jgi:hypothetical protein
MKNWLMLGTMFLLACPAAEKGSALKKEAPIKSVPTSQPAGQPSSQVESKAATPLALGEKARLVEHVLVTAAGEEVSLKSAAKEKGLLVIFTCNHCPWVKAWEDRTVALANAFLAQGIGAIAVNSTDPAQVDGESTKDNADTAQRLGMKYPYAVDKGSVLARAFGASKTPEVFLFDGSMQLVYHGAVDDNAKSPNEVKATFLKDALTAVAAGTKVELAETKAFGCSIKLYEPVS